MQNGFQANIVQKFNWQEESSAAMHPLCCRPKNSQANSTISETPGWVWHFPCRWGQLVDAFIRSRMSGEDLEVIDRTPLAGRLGFSSLCFQDWCGHWHWWSMRLVNLQWRHLNRNYIDSTVNGLGCCWAWRRSRCTSGIPRLGCHLCLSRQGLKQPKQSNLHL